MPKKGTSLLPEAAVPLICGARRGTSAGYSAHMTAREQPCSECRAVHRELERQRIAAKRARERANIAAGR